MTYATQIMISFLYDAFTMIFVFVPRASASAADVNAVLGPTDQYSQCTGKDQEKISINQPASLEFKMLIFRFLGQKD